MKNPEVYDLKRLHLSLAGSGNPWAAITPFRKGLLRALHDRLSSNDIEAKFGLSSDEVKEELTPLLLASLVKKQGGTYVPTFFIADASETRQVTNQSKTAGRSLAKTVMDHWSQIETAYLRLSPAQQHSLEDLGFILVGGQILDIGLLEALTREGTLMAPAPSRPSPDTPKANYYFWMVEGEFSDLGRYGMDETDLPWPGWSFLTFGQNIVDGTWNNDREACEKTCSNLVKANVADTPESLAKHLKAAVFNSADTAIWSNIADECTAAMVNVYLKSEPTLRALFSTLEASTYAPNSFSEFFCWYDHLAYAWAIDELETNGLISIPTQRFTAALWQRTHQT